MPRRRKARASTAKFSKSSASRRLRPSHANVLPTIQRLAKGTKPLASPRLTISSRQQPIPATAAAVAGTGRWRLEIVARDAAEGFRPLPKRWIVERTFAWLGRCRRLAKDFENLAVNALAFLCLGMIRLMLRRLAKASDRS